MYDDLIEEIRRDYHIPPFFPDEGIEGFIHDGIYRLSNLNPGRNLEKDRNYRMLLKTYVYYAYHGKLDSWRENYATDILEWQLGSDINDSAT